MPVRTSIKKRDGISPFLAVALVLLLALVRAQPASAQGLAPSMQVEQPAGTVLGSGATVDFGTVDLDSGVEITFTVRNTGTAALILSGAMIDGPNAGDFSVDPRALQTALAPGGQGSVVVTFAASAQAARTAVLHLASTATGGGTAATLDINLSGDGPPVLAPTFVTAGAVPNIYKGFTATGLKLGPVTLGFAPPVGRPLTLVSNTSAAPVAGTFTGLAEGALVTSVFKGDTLYFALSYKGGDGNDVTLARVPGPGQVPSYDWSVFAGAQGGGGSSDGTGPAAQFASPSAVAMAPDGTLVVADTGNSTIRRITPAGVTVTIAGTAGQPGTADGPGTEARFNRPQGIVVAPDGTIYVADTGSGTIRRISPGGWVATLAGSPGTDLFSSPRYSVDGTGAAAQFSTPTGLALDTAGTLYVGDAGTETIRKVTPGGVVTTLGSALLPGETVNTTAASGTPMVSTVPTGTSGATSPSTVTPGSGGNTLTSVTTAQGSLVVTLTSISTWRPTVRMLGVVVGPAGQVYVADSLRSDGVRVIAPDGTVSLATFIESPIASLSWYPFDRCGGLAQDAAGNLYLTSTLNQTVGRLNTHPTGFNSNVAGLISLLAGNSYYPGSDDTRFYGTVTSSASFNCPLGVAAAADGTVYVADANNNTIRAVSPAGIVTTLAGTPLRTGHDDGPALGPVIGAASFQKPRELACDAAGNVYVADGGNSEVRKVSPAGVTTLGGTAFPPIQTGVSPPPAPFNAPHAVAVDAAGNVYVADTGSGTVRKITPDGAVTVLFTSGSTTTVNGTVLGFDLESVGVDAAGNVYASDGLWGQVCKITPAGVASLLLPPSTDAFPNIFIEDPDWFRHPVELAVTPGGTVYVADGVDDVIRKITPAGNVSILAGSGFAGNADGMGTAASFYVPGALALDAAGCLYVLDGWNGSVRKVTPAGMVTTLASLNGPVQPVGSPGEPWTYTFPNSTVHVTDIPTYGVSLRNLGHPEGLAVGPGGTLIVSSSQSDSLFQGRPVMRPLVTAVVPVAGRTSATLGAQVNPNGLAATVRVDYGTDPGLASSVTVDFSANDNVSHPVQALLAGLNTDTVYYYRLTAANLDGATSVSGTFVTPGTHTAVLAGLSADAGPLTPVFDPAVTSYSLGVASGLSSVVLTPVLTDAGGTVSVNGVPATPGSPAAPVSLNPGSTSIPVQVTAQDGATTKTYVVVVTRHSHAEEWRVRWFGSAANVGPAADYADPDGDGVPNLVEFATGTNPTVRSRPPGVTALEGANLSFTYTRAAVAVADGCAFTVEWATTLPAKAWSTAGVTETVLADDGVLQTVKALIPRPGSRALFVHLRIVPP